MAAFFVAVCYMVARTFLLGTFHALLRPENSSMPEFRGYLGAWMHLRNPGFLFSHPLFCHYVPQHFCLFMECLDPFEILAMGVISQGGSALGLCFSSLLLFHPIVSFTPESAIIVLLFRPNPRLHKSLATLPFLNFLLAFIFYRFVYDFADTLKPSWTENLGREIEKSEWVR
jgi:hypothetical protein